MFSVVHDDTRFRAVLLQELLRFQRLDFNLGGGGGEGENVELIEGLHANVNGLRWLTPWEVSSRETSKVYW